MYYHQRYPDNLSAIQLYTAEPNSDLPEGLYAFLELYCPDPICECKEVKIEITKQSSMDLNYFETSDTPIATLRYDWNAPLCEENPSLDEEGYQSEWANAGRQAFINYVEVASAYNDELATRFVLMKIEPGCEATYSGKQNKLSVRNAPKLGRNDPCSCGSGKKYKKCCLDK
jgi:hypothetical protein